MSFHHLAVFWLMCVQTDTRSKVIPLSPSSILSSLLHLLSPLLSSSSIMPSFTHTHAHPHSLSIGNPPLSLVVWISVPKPLVMVFSPLFCYGLPTFSCLKSLVVLCLLHPATQETLINGQTVSFLLRVYNASSLPKAQCVGRIPTSFTSSWYWAHFAL